MAVHENPYVAPLDDALQPPGKRPPRWRLIPAVLCGIVGLLSFAIGLIGVGMFAYQLATEAAPLGDLPPRFYVFMVGVCTVYLGFGASWLMASRWYWQQHYRYAVAATVLGILVPVIITWLMMLLR